MAIIKEEIKDFIEQSFKIKKGDIDEKAALLDLGSIYSVGIISMIKFIEDTYNIIVEDEDITTENFGTVKDIVNYVESHI
ncbi:MAG: acyl carrier protein [Lachnospiraceae bacterium]|nr:acyl carrier protein [Lachnospiraceae bacterium]